MIRLLGILVLVVVGLIVWLCLKSPIVLGESDEPRHIEVEASDKETHHTSPTQNSWKNNFRVQLPASDPGKYDPTLPQWAEWNRREKADMYWEWKMPINFYGKVVEYTTGESVEGVEIAFSWTDLSLDGGGRKTLFSDTKGNFSLTGITGKHLSVNALKKDGYIRSNIGARFGFEYAAFFEPHYHQPDPNHPVVFRMKKIGETEPLVYRDTLYGLNPNGTPQYLDFSI